MGLHAMCVVSGFDPKIEAHHYSAPPSRRGNRTSMHDFGAAISEAFRLIAALDANLAEIVWLSLKVSISATCLAALIGLPVGALVAIARFPGRPIVILLVNALM